MPKQNHKSDINIGQDRWITFGDLEGKQSNAVNIDDSVLELSKLWDVLETQCVAECCGIDAFALWPEDIKKATQSIGKQETLTKLRALKQFVILTRSEVVVSKRLNNFF